ncbi:TIGR00730 family Rossman fold protein [Saccharothrix sp. S26]|uniref:LOG family protein n=1 Tax=Saccharothrix sp. S26 TaxID=2907215 RepID=UPI001F3E997C|nr:TIGR00730 family Rossman fold protein [Saccharothrix sp. S26]MCE6994536.1 TIGR00730 family Rossman fold protein [Saccharothrix sp. S26]
MTAVTVYCGSLRTVPDSYLELAADVGRRIAARGWSLVWGGGRTAMMGAVARAAREGGARTTGVIPRGLVDREVADTDSDDLLVVETMRDRKALMEAHGDAFLALPGGIGTCEELFEVWTARVLAMHAKPVVVLDVDGHYRGLVSWLGELRERGFVSPFALDSLVVTDDVETALDACAS